MARNLPLHLALALASMILIGPSVASAASITLATTIRDFKDSHDDFESAVGGGGFHTGLVHTLLGVDGKPVYVGGPSLSTATNFSHWYNDTPLINATLTGSLTASEAVAGSGIYTFSSSAYFPIDGLGFGNQSRSHNYHFTTEIHTSFTYTGFGAGADFTFSGDDDVWVYVDKKLVIDLGGIHGPVSGSTDIDLLGLTLGSSYSLDIFHAERQTVGSNFSFTTAAVLVSVPVPATAALLLIGLILGGLRFRKTA